MNKLLLGSVGMGKTYRLVQIINSSDAKNIVIVDKDNELKTLIRINPNKKYLYFDFNELTLMEFEKSLTELKALTEKTLVVFDDCFPDQALKLFKTARGFNWDVCYATQMLPDNAETFISNTHELTIFNIKNLKELDELMNFVNFN